MKKKFLFWGMLLVLISTLSFSKGLLITRNSSSTGDIPDTPEAKQIMKTIENAYDIESEAAFTFDVKKLPTVFINDPRFPLPESTLQVVREMTDNMALESAGYLDYKIAYYSWTANAILHFEEVQKKAKSENRSLTEEEIQSLTDKYGRSAPARADRPTRKIPIKFIAMEINEDIATVVIDDGPWTLEMYLVLVDKKWYVTGIKGLAFHP
jgi:hypothetical protein